MVKRPINLSYSQLKLTVNKVTSQQYESKQLTISISSNSICGWALIFCCCCICANVWNRGPTPWFFCSCCPIDLCWTCCLICCCWLGFTNFIDCWLGFCGRICPGLCILYCCWLDAMGLAIWFGADCRTCSWGFASLTWLVVGSLIGDWLGFVWGCWLGVCCRRAWLAARGLGIWRVCDLGCCFWKKQRNKNNF